MTSSTTPPRTPATSVRRTGWALAALYALVAFEFFYMATPFAAFFYAALRPGLDALARLPGGAWLASFFLPHFAETRSALIDAHEAVGLVLLGGGLLGFAVGAVQIYGAKLRQRGAVTGGVYRWIRHPQYAALVVSGFGMVLVWPRFLVLALLVTMLFAYRGLAALEEAECAARFGQPYLDYLARTRRFFPAPVRRTRAVSPPAPGRPATVARSVLAWAGALALALGLARAIQGQAVRSLFVHTTGSATYLSLVRIPDARLAQVVAAAERDPDVAGRLQVARAGGAALLVYVLPEGGYISEIPMRPPPGAECHGVPPERPGRGHTLVVTEVQQQGGAPGGAALLRQARTRTPLFEVRLDAADRVERIDPPLEERRYQGTPVPVI